MTHLYDALADATAQLEHEQAQLERLTQLRSGDRVRTTGAKFNDEIGTVKAVYRNISLASVILDNRALMIAANVTAVTFELDELTRIEPAQSKGVNDGA